MCIHCGAVLSEDWMGRTSEMYVDGNHPAFPEVVSACKCV